MDENLQPTKRHKQEPNYFEQVKEAAESDPSLKGQTLNEARYWIKKAMLQVTSMGDQDKVAKVREWSNKCERANIERRLNDEENFFKKHPDGKISSLMIPGVDNLFVEAKARGAQVDDLEARWNQTRQRIEASPGYKPQPAMKPDLEDDAKRGDVTGEPFDDIYAGMGDEE